MRNENNKIQIPNVDKGYTERTADTLLALRQEDIICSMPAPVTGKHRFLPIMYLIFPEKAPGTALTKPTMI